MKGKWNCTHLNGLFCHAFYKALRHESFQRNSGESKLGGYKASYRPNMMDHLHFPIPVLHTANPFAGQLDSSHYIMLRRHSFCSRGDPNQEKPRALPAHPHLLTNPGIHVTPLAATPPPRHAGEHHTLPETTSNSPSINIHTTLPYPQPSKRFGIKRNGPWNDFA